MRSIAIEAQRRLLERRQDLVGLRQRVNDYEKELLQTPENDWPGASATQQAASVLEELSSNELRDLREIDAALHRLKVRTYGRCERCDAAIGRLRLQAIPEARHCLACSAQQEVDT